MSAIAIPDIRTLQQLSEQAVSERERRGDLAHELFVPAVHLAQQVAAQLQAYRLDGEMLSVRDPGAEDLSAYEKYRMYQDSIDQAEGRRWYHVAHAYWRRKGLTLRLQQAPVLVFQASRLEAYPLWDPRQPDLVWDLQDPPALPVKITGDTWETVKLPTAEILAQWSQDALALMQNVYRRERNRAEHLSAGIAQSAAALDELSV